MSLNLRDNSSMILAVSSLASNYLKHNVRYRQLYKDYHIPTATYLYLAPEFRGKFLVTCLKLRLARPIPDAVDMWRRAGGTSVKANDAK